MSARFGPCARLARAILVRSVWDSDAGDALANLDAIYLARVRTRSKGAAEAWYLGQAVTFGPRLWIDRRGRPRPTGPRDRSMLAAWLDDVRADVRFAVRGFRRSPGFTFAAVGTLTLGIAATTLIYAVLRGVVLRPLPFPEPERLVRVWPEDALALTHDTFLELQRRVESSELTAFADRRFAIQGVARPDEVSGAAVSWNHFRVLGRPPASGRAFSAEDGMPGGEPVALISNELWRTRFGADPSIIGRRVGLFTAAAIPMVPGAFAGTPYTVIGVLPPDYRPLGYPIDVITPLVADPGESSFSNMGELRVLGRLEGGETRDRLRAELAAAARAIPELDGARDEIEAATVVELGEAATGHVRSALLLTFWAVAVVLLIACVNVANLMLARSQGRNGELRVRRALGAGTRRLTRQLLTECGVLATVSTVIGVGAVAAILPAIVPLLPADLATAAGAITIDRSVLALAILLIAVSLLTAGVLPAITATRRTSAPRGPRGGIGGSRRANRASQFLIVGELGLAVVLASSAGLLLKSLSRLAEVDPGFDPRGVQTVRVAPSDERYADAELRRRLIDRLLEGIRTLPGVSSAGAIHFLPIADGGPAINFLTDPADPESRQPTGYRVITPGYLRTLAIPVLAGRDIAPTDRTGDAPVGLVNQALADRLWPGEDPIGKRLYRTSGQVWFTVVGVTGDVRQAALGLAPRPEAYLPLAQTEWASAMSIVARVTGEEAAIASVLEGVVWAVDPDLPVTRTAAMQELLGASVSGPRFYGIVFSTFAGLAMVLGAIGVYGATSFLVRQRVDEIGIRIALGATRAGILAGELGRASRVASLGMFLGLVGALACSRLLSSLLYEVRPLDPGVHLLATMTLGGVALAAAWAPAWRAARADPLTSIRVDRGPR